VRPRAQYEHLLEPSRSSLEGSRLGRVIEDAVPDRESLRLRQDRVGARRVRREEKMVHPPIGVEATPRPPIYTSHGQTSWARGWMVME
jgi:hypothetical protein